MGRAAYDEIADWYDEAIRTGPLSPAHDFVVPAVLDAVGDGAESWRVCDLACGQGVVSRVLARRGASVIGVDISKELLAIAERYEQDEPLGITYLLDDARTLRALDETGFDAVVCSMALMDISDLDACLCSVVRILRPGGRFVFSTVHPCFLPPGSPRWNEYEDGSVRLEVSRYFEEGFWRSDNPDGVRGRVGAHHRTLSTYVNALSRAGLMIDRLAEPPATGELAERVPGYLEVPPFLIARCTKHRTASGPDHQ